MGETKRIITTELTPDNVSEFIRHELRYCKIFGSDRLSFEMEGSNKGKSIAVTMDSNEISVDVCGFNGVNIDIADLDKNVYVFMRNGSTILHKGSYDIYCPVESMTSPEKQVLVCGEGVVEYSHNSRKGYSCKIDRPKTGGFFTMVYGQPFISSKTNPSYEICGKKYEKSREVITFIPGNSFVKEVVFPSINTFVDKLRGTTWNLIHLRDFSGSWSNNMIRWLKQGELPEPRFDAAWLVTMDYKEIGLIPSAYFEENGLEVDANKLEAWKDRLIKLW